MTLPLRYIPDSKCEHPFTAVSTAGDGTLSTGEDGYARSEDFVAEQDIYYVKETNVPEAYPFQIPETVWEVSVTSGELQNWRLPMELWRRSISRRLLKKPPKAEHRQPLSGAEFDIYKDAACTIKVGSVGPTEEMEQQVLQALQREVHLLSEGNKAPKGTS